MMSEIKEVFIIFVMTLFIGSCAIALLDSSIEVNKNKKCNYYSIASYHPARVVVCELFKERFNGQD